MKHDLRDYVPDVARVLKDYAPEAVKERRRKALELLERPTPPPARVSTPSPWVKAGGQAGEIDKAALPSAMAPKVEEQAAATAVVPAVREAAARRSWRVVAACATVGAMMLLVAVLVQVGKAPQVKADAMGVRVAVESVGAGGPGGVVPGGMVPAAMSSATATVEPSATATASSAPTAGAPVTRGTKPPGKVPGDRGDPYDAAPARPTPTVAPTSEKAAEAPPPTPPKPAGSAQDPGLNE
jgi:hypothetical protein